MINIAAAIGEAIISGNIGKVFTGIGQLARDIRAAITGKLDPKDAAEIESKLLQIEHASSQAQSAINLQEAKHKSIFVAGWRPYIGWVCGTALLWQFMLKDMLIWIFAIAKVNVPPPPSIDIGQLIGIIVGMLGLAGYRTYEKKKGIQSLH